ncbi:DUF748 domain-containing protein [Vibrio sp. MEBiC08052]|uniref:DUF748 domain-containing protein n=1 Tax=Vibrio sp. MEBiC08052 TaxID=1761910 RepID=UPI0007407906|nr:DUF748 domain-containing protein [Vibrio sp. MEBiC08052]KUI98670.1 hypothetical protein VRK_20000 [Vibrio sp. MEBiC08052]
MTHVFAKLWRRFRQLPRVFRVSSYLLLCYAAYALLLGVITPLILQSQMPKFLSERLGREVQIAHISINPFLLRVRVEDFQIMTREQQGVLASIGQTELMFSFWRSLLHLTPTIDHLWMTQPSLNLVRYKAASGQLRFNISDIVERLSSRQTPPSQSTEPPQSTDTVPSIAAFRSEDIHLSQGRVQFSDQVSGALLSYHGLDIRLQQFDTQATMVQLPSEPSQSSAPDKSSTSTLLPNRYQLQITGADQSQLQLSGQLQLLPLKISGELSLQSVTLAPFWPFAADIIPARLTDGVIDFHTHYDLQDIHNHIVYTTRQGELTLQQLVFQADQKPQVKLSQLSLSDIALNGAEQILDIAQLQLSGLWVNGQLDAQGLDLQHLFTPIQNADVTPSQATPAENQPATSSSWLVRLHQFRMTGTDLNLAEQQQTSGVHWRIYNLSLSTGEIDSHLSQPIDYQLAFDIASDPHHPPENAQGHFTAQGVVNPQQLSTSGEIDLQRLELSQFQPYLQSYLNLQLSNGVFSTQGHFQVNPAAYDVRYQGTAALNQLMIKDTRNRQPLLKWESMSIDAISFDQTAHQLTIHQVTLDKPYAKILIDPNRNTNIDHLVIESHPGKISEAPSASVKPDTQLQPKSESRSPFQFEIGAIKISHGSAFFADQSLTPNFATGIESLEGEIIRLSSNPAQNAQVQLTGKIDQYAPVSIHGEINPLSEPPYLDLAVNFNRVELTSVNPYSGTYAGYYIDKGQLTLGLQYQLEQNQLIGKNHIVIDQLQLGKASNSEQALNLPLKLAVALLQDRHGVIDLGLDISGDLDNPSFSFGSIVMTALTNMLAKAVTAPFTLLAGLVGSDDELNIVQFEPGRATLSTAEQARLKTLASALTDRPKLSVSAKGHVSLTQDSQAIKAMKLQQQLRRQSGVDPLPAELSASRFPASGPLVEALNKLFSTELQKQPDAERQKIIQQLQGENPDVEPDPAAVTTRLHIAMYNQLLNAQAVSHDELGYLAQSRGNAVKAFLVNDAGLPPERIFLLDSKTELNDREPQVKLILSAD